MIKIVTTVYAWPTGKNEILINLKSKIVRYLSYRNHISTKNTQLFIFLNSSSGKYAFST